MTEPERTSSPWKLQVVIACVALAIILLNIWGVQAGAVESPLLSLVIAGGAAVYALIALRRIGRRKTKADPRAPEDQNS